MSLNLPINSENISTLIRQRLREGDYLPCDLTFDHRISESSSYINLFSHKWKYNPLTDKCMQDPKQFFHELLSCSPEKVNIDPLIIQATHVLNKYDDFKIQAYFDRTSYCPGYEQAYEWEYGAFLYEKSCNGTPNPNDFSDCITYECISIYARILFPEELNLLQKKRQIYGAILLILYGFVLAMIWYISTLAHS